MLILLAIAGLFLAATLGTIKLTGGSTFWSRHHGIALAYAGSFLSLASLIYSLRKQGIIENGSLGKWFNIHIIVGGAGLLLLLAHGRFEFQALVPGLSSAAMALVGLTGLFGWYMYLTKVNALVSEIHSMEEAEEFVLAKMASSAFRFWRYVHIMATVIAFFFTIVHGISLIVFRGQF